MPGTNLTRDEAGERARLLYVDSYAVQLDLTSSETTFGSTTTITFSCSEPGSSTFADLVGADVQEITLNGRPVDVSAYADSRIALDDLAENNVLRVVAVCAYSRTGEGLHRFVDPADGRVYLYTQFEVPDARRMFTTFEQPDLKAVFSFSVTAPAGWEVVSNAPTPAPIAVRDGVARWDFEPTARLSTYITALIAGEYHVVRDTYQGAFAEIPLGLFCRQSVSSHLDADEIFEITRQGFDLFEGAFAMGYPFGKYDQLFVPEYNMGAMENAGAVTFRDEYLFRSRQTVSAYESRANTILHEMAHMWFGDLVTMRWWDDLWLNESFAEWASHHAASTGTKYTDAWTGFTNLRKNWAYRQDQLPSTHPIAADNVDLQAVEVNFDGITYAKGASALRQLVAWVGEPEFFAGLRSYFAEHAYGNTVLQDLLGHLEAASGRELGSWAKEWLQTSGVNTLSPDFDVDSTGAFTSFAVRQIAHPDFPTLRRHRIAIGLYDRGDEGLVRRERLEVDITGESTDIDALVGIPRPDLVLLNDDDLTYAKIRLDQRSLATLVSGIDTIAESLPRALCWGAAWDMTRDAEMRASDFVALVLQGVGTESDLTAVGALLRQAQLAVNSYSAPARRGDLQRRWEQGLRTLVEAAEAGSDHQLALMRAYATAVRSDDGADFLQGLLDGATELPGLTVDTGLRWALVQSLARRVRIGEPEIAAELARDNTIEGQEEAAAARAGQGTAQAKEQAWHLAVERDDVPNETQRSIATAFQVAGQADVLRPYVARYLEAAGTVWETLGTQRATNVLVAMFPRSLVDETTLEAVDDWLADTDANPAAKRLVEEGRSDLQRGLTAQAFDATG
ncbi:MAG: Membrane alanine aminopeptidase N [uncultured Nocardioidaceae bacterium]|uniref:Aminopeptidase N n=1 Tax=uncultured Nocardioidaceae bacterium TaxID=253824 RepID=A0A6J4MFY5_9ACTN|nr:MAG: Membrane alanine aminopeptidase N [uncultured Nocardioidaceae bacterium]